MWINIYKHVKDKNKDKNKEIELQKINQVNKNYSK